MTKLRQRRWPELGIRLAYRQPLLVLMLLTLSGCVGVGHSCDFSLGRVPESLSADDPRLHPLYEATDKRVDRLGMGFTPLPKGRDDVDIRVEWQSGDGYDAMLHIVGKTSRTVAFERTSAGYRWIGEQEIFEGPNSFDSVDGRYRESISLTYHLPPMRGTVNRLVVSYTGEVPALTSIIDLSLADVQPWLLKWGYK